MQEGLFAKYKYSRYTVMIVCLHFTVLCIHNAVRKLSLERSKENGPTEFHPITDKGWLSLQCVMFSDILLVVDFRA